MIHDSSFHIFEVLGTIAPHPLTTAYFRIEKPLTTGSLTTGHPHIILLENVPGGVTPGLFLEAVYLAHGQKSSDC